MTRSQLIINREAMTIVMARVFNASPERLWQIYTDPAMIPRWWGSRQGNTVVETMDVRVGGRWRYIQSYTDGSRHAFRGEYQVVDPPHRLAATFEYEPMAGQIVTDSYRFTALPGDKTEVTVTTSFPSLEALEAMAQTGLEAGANDSWARIDALLAAVEEG